jgi:uncharacterized membrane protein
LVAGSLTILRGERRRPALAATVFSIVATFYGLSVTLGSGRTADVAYHASVLGVLLLVLALLLFSPRSS